MTDNECMETINRRLAKNPRPCTDAEIECVICGRPVKVTARTSYLHVQDGGAVAVTEAEAEAMDKAADLGLQPIGSDCLRGQSALKAYVQVSK